MASTTMTDPVPDTGREPEPMTERVVVRSFEDYDGAKRAVDRLTVGRIPDKRITVMGRGLRWREAFGAERFTKAAAAGGALLTAAAALVLWAFGALDSNFTWLGATVAGVAMGAVLGAVLGVVAWRLTHRDKTVPETGHVDVGRYDVLVEVDQAGRARDLLDKR